MRKKLDTRFPASRIKNIMQADEDVGKIALAVPLLVSKALELFLQDLCDRTYNVTLQSGVKTMNAVHLKQCVHGFNAFDFLRDIVSQVPDLGAPDASNQERSAKKRKPADEDNGSDEESKRSRTHETAAHSSNRRGRGRPRGRGRGGRGAQGTERDNSYTDKFEDNPGTSPQNDENGHHPSFENIEEGLTMSRDKQVAACTGGNGRVVLNFDLNLVWEENADTDIVLASDSTEKHAVELPPATATTIKQEVELAPAIASTEKHEAEMASRTPSTAKHEEYPEWPISEMYRMGIDPLQLAVPGRRLDEEEDYDNEEG